MIQLQDISLSVRTRNKHKALFARASACVRRGTRVGVLGHKGVGKSVFLRLLCGTLWPDSGRILRTMRPSWRITGIVGIAPRMTGRDQLWLTCRLYNTDGRRATRFLDAFPRQAGLLDQPLQGYSRTDRQDFQFLLAAAVGFDCYLLDGATAMNLPRLSKAYPAVFRDMAEAGLVLAAANPGVLHKFCTRAIVIADGGLHEFDDLDQAVELYRASSPGESAREAEFTPAEDDSEDGLF